jgi:hypothetical protein
MGFTQKIVSYKNVEPSQYEFLSNNVRIRYMQLTYNLFFVLFLLIYYIIILRVNFCSDIWYCNILAYYLDN